MEDLLIAILQCVFEFLMEVFGFWPLDWLGWPDWPKGLAGKCIGWFIFGCCLAGISIYIFKYTWISHPALRITNLILAPITSAFISQAIARHRARKDQDIEPRHKFWQAFWFAFGVVVIRFAFATRQ